jgi:hypothetical protein
MKVIAAAAAILGVMAAGPALSQTTGSTSQQNAQALAPASGQQNLTAVQKTKQDLQSAGHQDVNVVAESFIVQAKTSDGNLMTCLRP